MNKESFFISRFSDNRIGDDGVRIDKKVYSMDAFFENVHFKREWMTLKQIAQKAMLVNLSDAIAMNARPRYALLSVAIPPSFSLKQLEELAEGFLETARAYNVAIVGGDTIANVKLDISITIISECDRPLNRKGLRRGDWLAYTGDLGHSARDLRRLMRGGYVGSHSRFMHPTLRKAFMEKAGQWLSGGMDISDGLGTELSRLSRINRSGYRFVKSINKQALCSGEEYEMLISFPNRHRHKIARIARQTRTPLNIIAKSCRGSYRSHCKQHHF